MTVSRRNALARVAIAALAAALVLATGCAKGREFCTVCGRTECRAMVFTIRLEDGKTVRTCCPRCGLHYIETTHPKVASLAVRDFETARTIDAGAATYVDGSDVNPCTAMAGAPPPTDERGCCLKAVYDRCSPSLIAFASREAARRFADEHGGLLRSFAEVRAARPPASRSPG